LPEVREPWSSRTGGALMDFILVILPIEA
jgi:hypothetical protein